MSDIEMKDQVEDQTENQVEDQELETSEPPNPTTEPEQDPNDENDPGNDTDKEQPIKVEETGSAGTTTTTTTTSAAITTTSSTDTTASSAPTENPSEPTKPTETELKKEVPEPQDPTSQPPSHNNDVDIDDVDDEITNDVDPQKQIDEANEKEKSPEEDPLKPIIHPIPLQRKDKSLKELLNLMDEYAPIIPDAVTDFYLAKAGFETTDKRIKRLLALATQKFVSDIASDAYQYSRIRSATSVSNSSNPQARARALMAGMSGAAAAQASGAAPTATGAPGPPGGSGNQGKLVLTMEDLGNALAEYGVNIKTPDFYR